MELVVAKYFSFPAVRLVGRDHFTISIILNEGSMLFAAGVEGPLYQLKSFTRSLPAVVGKGLVGLGHAMHVFFLLDGSAAAIGRVEQFIRQLIDHALLTASAAVGQNPANRQRRPAVGIH